MCTVEKKIITRNEYAIEKYENMKNNSFLKIHLCINKMKQSIFLSSLIHVEHFWILYAYYHCVRKTENTVYQESPIKYNLIYKFRTTLNVSYFLSFNNG